MHTSLAKNGSVTVETSILLPFFMYIWISLLYFIEIFSLHSVVESSLYQYAKEVASCGSSMAVGIAGNIYGKNQVLKFGEGKIEENSCLNRGEKGLLVFVKEEEDWITVFGKYEVQLPYSFGWKITYPVTQKVKLRCFTGQSGKKDETKEMVYITKYGDVYHVDIHCTYLQLSIQKVTRAKVDSIKNEGGDFYTPCEKCKPDENIENDNVYITREGSRYHSTTSCNGLKRMIRCVTKKEVKGRKVCSRCGG